MMRDKSRDTFLGCWDEHGHEMHCAHDACPDHSRCTAGCADRAARVITQEIVNEELMKALANGYFCGLSSWTVAEIVRDMLDCSSAFEKSSVEELTPLVNTWYEARLAIGDSQAGKAADC